MRKIKDLSDAEANRYAIDMSEIQCDVINEIVSLADKYGLDRDKVMKHFATVMMVMAGSVSFEGYEISEEEADENRG